MAPSAVFGIDGAEHFVAALDAQALQELRDLADTALDEGPGARISHPGLPTILDAGGAIGAVAQRCLGETPWPVRVVMFDKTPAANWTVAWHQDRTIAVRERIDAPGFGPWSRKHGALHVAPPPDVLARMATLRVHLDDCGADNAPLIVALNSHRLGRVAAAQASARAADRPVLICTARAGDIWAYATLILHASRRAACPTRRRVLQIDYAIDDLPGGLQWAGVD